MCACVEPQLPKSITVHHGETLLRPWHTPTTSNFLVQAYERLFRWYCNCRDDGKSNCLFVINTSLERCINDEPWTSEILYLIVASHPQLIRYKPIGQFAFHAHTSTTMLRVLCFCGFTGNKYIFSQEVSLILLLPTLQSIINSVTNSFHVFEPYAQTLSNLVGIFTISKKIFCFLVVSFFALTQILT